MFESTIFQPTQQHTNFFTMTDEEIVTAHAVAIHHLETALQEDSPGIPYWRKQVQRTRVLVQCIASHIPEGNVEMALQSFHIAIKRYVKDPNTQLAAAIQANIHFLANPEEGLE